MWIILFFLSLNSFALDSFERIKNVRILKTFDNNIILLNKGLEDGLMRNDHIKLINEIEGYASRAICLKSSSDKSYWKIYRVPYAQAFSKDYTYTIVGAGDREIPENIKNIRKEIQQIPSDEKRAETDSPDPFKIREDMTEQLTKKDQIKQTKWDKKQAVLEEAIDLEKIRQQISNYHLSIYASPYTKQSINNGESLRFGIKGFNYGDRYQLLTHFEKQKTKLNDPVTNESITSDSTFGEAQFVIKNLSPNFSSLTLVNYNSTNFGTLGTPNSHYQFGPLGFTWHVYESRSWEYLNLSYIPLYDVRETETLNNSNEKQIVKTNGIRHGVKLSFKKKINERAALENHLWIKPFQDPATWQLEADNLNLSNDLKLAFNLTGKLYFDYNFIYQKDKIWKTLNNFSDTNIINSANLRYDFDL